MFASNRCQRFGGDLDVLTLVLRSQSFVVAKQCIPA
jgi:hypothetical protein